MRAAAPRVGELAIALIPPGGPPVQRGHPVRMLAPRPQPQHLREQRVVAVPAGPDRPDKRVTGPMAMLDLIDGFKKSMKGDTITGDLLSMSGSDVRERVGRSHGRVGRRSTFWRRSFAVR